MAKRKKPNPQPPRQKAAPVMGFVVELFDAKHNKWVEVDQAETLEAAQANVDRSQKYSDGLQYRARAKQE